MVCFHFGFALLLRLMHKLDEDTRRPVESEGKCACTLMTQYKMFKSLTDFRMTFFFSRFFHFQIDAYKFNDSIDKIVKWLTLFFFVTINRYYVYGNLQNHVIGVNKVSKRQTIKLASGFFVVVAVVSC